MTVKIFFIRLGVLIAGAMAAIPLFAVTIHALIYFKIIPQELQQQSYEGYGMTLATHAVIVWMCCIVAGFASIFVKDDWRYVLLLSPAYAPPFFITAHALMQ